MTFLLFVLLFANGIGEASHGPLGHILTSVTTVFSDTDTQWVVFLCLEIYFHSFSFVFSLENEFHAKDQGAKDIIGDSTNEPARFPPLLCHPMH